MKKGAKLGIGLGAIVLTGVVITIAALNGGGDAAQVRIETVQQRDLTATVTASGWIRPHRKVDVQSDIMGRITQLLVKEGHVVRRGQILLRIDPTQYEAAANRAQASVSESLAREAQARANVLQAERAHERLRNMATANANLVSRQQLEEAETQVLVQTEMLRAARYGVEQSRAALAEARNQLEKTVIRAPMDGVITRLNVEEGETAIVGTMNNAGSLLLTVADLGTMEAVVRVDETDIPDLKLGDSATIEIDAFPRRKFRGTVTEIGHSSVRSPEQQAQSGTGQGQAIDFEVVITLADPPQSLRSDLSASADITTATRAGALAIPIIALTVREQDSVKALPNETPGAAAAGEVANGPQKDQEGVFVVRQGKAQFVPVQIGIAGREYFEVLTGLQAGDSIVAGPYEVIRSLENDKSVRAIQTAPAGSAAARKAS